MSGGQYQNFSSSTSTFSPPSRQGHGVGQIYQARHAVTGMRVVHKAYSDVGGWNKRVSVCPPRLTHVVYNKSLLAPVTMDIDPNYHRVRKEEKEQIKVLNNRFASFIDKVCYLEQQNKMLSTKWSLLQEQTPDSQSSISRTFEAYIANLHHHLDTLGHDKVRLEGDLHNMQELMEDFKKKYEDEIHKRNDCENEFVLMKKDSDAAYLGRVELEATLDNLNDEVHFLRRLYEQELHELQIQIKDTSVVVEMDNSRNLDMDAIVAEVKAQYEEIANRSKAEAETWYRQKYEEMQVSVTKYGDEMKSSKVEIAESNRRITRLESEVVTVKTQRTQMETQIVEAEERGDTAVRDARTRIKDVEAALQRAKQDMARQVREYQSLMNIKLALDIEIATYRKLLEGEESRLVHGIQAIQVTQNQYRNYHSYPMETSGSTLDLHNSSMIESSSSHGFSSSSTTSSTSRDIAQTVTVKKSTSVEQLIG